MDYIDTIIHSNLPALLKDQLLAHLEREHHWIASQMPTVITDEDLRTMTIIE